MQLTGICHVVAMPMGNPRDITYRAVDVLKGSDLVICENPSHSARIFREYDIHSKTARLYNSMSEKDFLPFLQLLQQGKTISIVSDAGTPGISDPGSQIIRFFRNNGIRISPVPGPSTLSAIMSVSGFQANPTFFLGFLSEKKNKKTEQLKNYQTQEGLMVIFESVYKIRQTLAIIKELYAEADIIIGRELTKTYEEILYFSSAREIDVEKVKDKGEFVILINNFRKKSYQANSEKSDNI